MTPRADERIAGLYAVPLEQFTPERNALATELRVSGDAEGAALVKALRKPTAAAWAVNQLVRGEPDLVEALLGAGGELRQAHRQAASGRGSEQLRAAADAERTAVELLVARAAAVLGRPVTPALAESIRNSLHAASSDDTARERVRAGTLVTELRPVGLGPVPAAGTQRSKQAPPKAPPRVDSKRELRAAATEEAALQREFDAAARALARAEESYARAREAAEAAAEREKDARKRMREARSALADAQRRRARLERD